MSFLGKRHTLQTRQKMSDSHKGLKFTKEHKQNISLAREGKKQPKISISLRKAYAEGRLINPMSTQHPKYQEAVAKIRAANTNRGCREETKLKIRQSLLGHSVSDEARRKMSESQKTRFSSQTERAKMSEVRHKIWQVPEYRAKLLTAERYGKIRQKIQLLYASDPTYRSRIGEGTRLAMQRADVRVRYLAGIKRRSANPEWHKKVLVSRRPTDLEAKVIDVINEFDLPFRYTGNGAFHLAGLNPDFVRTDGHKCVVEVFGEFWHEPEDEDTKCSIYAQAGWDSIILWGKEVKSLSPVQLARRLEGENA